MAHSLDPAHGPQAHLLGRGKGVDLANPLHFVGAVVLDDRVVPQSVKVGSLAEELELQIVAAAIAPIADVHRLVQIFDEMDEKPQRLRHRPPKR